MDKDETKYDSIFQLWEQNSQISISTGLEKQYEEEELLSDDLNNL